MKRFRWLILTFCVLLSIPLGYFIFRTHQALAQEEHAELRYFADTLFLELENELGGFIAREEAREIDAYTRASDLSRLPRESYILGYFQNNPDGSFQTPLAVDGGAMTPADKGSMDKRVADLEGINQIFNTRRTDVSARTDVRPPEKIAAPKEESLHLPKNTWTCPGPRSRNPCWARNPGGWRRSPPAGLEPGQQGPAGF